MADADLPKNWEGAARWFLGGTIVFASGFEAVVKFWEGKFWEAGGSLFVAIALIAILLKWDSLKARMPNVMAALTRGATDARLWAVLLVALAIGFNFPGPQDPRATHLDWIFAIPLTIGLILFFAAWKYLRPAVGGLNAQAVVNQPPITDSTPQNQQRDRDLLVLLDFAVNQATIEMLDDLIERAPRKILAEPKVLTAERHADAVDYIQRVRGRLLGTYRAAEFMERITFAEHEAEGEIRKMPETERAAIGDTLDVRK